MELPDYYCRLGRFAPAHRLGTLALLYHRLGKAPLFTRKRGLTLPTRVFIRQLAELRAAGLQSALPGEPPGAPDKIWLTFDDGDTSSLAALEPLRAHGFRAVQFLVVSRLGKTNDWDRTGALLMNESQVRDWLAAGHAIGSHSMTHIRLATVPPAVAREEIYASRRYLEDHFGVPVETFAYPWGEWNQRLADEVAAAGYRSAFTTAPGINDASTNPYTLHRHGVWCSWRRPSDVWFSSTS